MTHKEKFTQFADALRAVTLVNETTGCWIYKSLAKEMTAMRKHRARTAKHKGFFTLAGTKLQVKLSSLNKFMEADNPYKNLPATTKVNVVRAFILIRGDLALQEMTASHLCHVAICVNPNHVVYEPLLYNQSRNVCGGPSGEQFACQHVPRCLRPGGGFPEFLEWHTTRTKPAHAPTQHSESPLLFSSVSRDRSKRSRSSE